MDLEHVRRLADLPRDPRLQASVANGDVFAALGADPLQLQQVSAIDALQGGECDFLIFSATRSNATGVKLSEKPTNQTSLTDIDGFSEEFMFAVSRILQVASFTSMICHAFQGCGFLEGQAQGKCLKPSATFPARIVNS